MKTKSNTYDQLIFELKNKLISQLLLGILSPLLLLIFLLTQYHQRVVFLICIHPELFLCIGMLLVAIICTLIFSLILISYKIKEKELKIKRLKKNGLFMELNVLNKDDLNTLKEGLIKDGK